MKLLRFCWIPVLLALSGCAVVEPTLTRDSLIRMHRSQAAYRAYMKQGELTPGFLSYFGQPPGQVSLSTGQRDLLPWQRQREQISLAVGERVIDKSFEQVFGALITSMPSLGVKVSVQVAQKEAGFITAKGYFSDDAKHLRNEEAREWAIGAGLPRGIFDEWNIQFEFRHAPLHQGAVDFTKIRFDEETLHLTVVKQRENQCKVKLRLSGVQYPKMLELCYRQIWTKLDKQLFLDKALD